MSQIKFLVTTESRAEFTLPVSEFDKEQASLFTCITHADLWAKQKAKLLNKTTHIYRVEGDLAHLSVCYNPANFKYYGLSFELDLIRVCEMDLTEYAKRI